MAAKKRGPLILAYSPKCLEEGFSEGQSIGDCGTLRSESPPFLGNSAGQEAVSSN